MNLKGYQSRALETAVYPRPDDYGFIIPIMYCALGAAGEAGEISDEVKKAWRNDQGITNERRAKIANEIGDNLWYLAQLSTELGLDLEDIAMDNLLKLRERQSKNELKEHG